MTYTPVANPTTDEPSHQATLSDGTTTVGLKLYNSRTGKVDHRAISRVSLNRSALKTYSGSQKYGDLEQPYIAIAQDDWSGGRGQADFEENTSKYYDAFNIDTTGEKLRLVGMPQYTTGYKTMYTSNHNQYSDDQTDWGNAMSAISLTGTEAYYAVQITHNDTAMNQFEFLMKYTGTPGSLSVKLYTDNAGSPDAVVVTGYTASYTSLGLSTTEWKRCTVNYAWTPGGSATVWLVIYQSTGTPSTSSCYKLAGFTNSAVTSKKSANGTSWSAATTDMIYRILPTSPLPFAAHFFEYRGQLYCATQPDDGTAGKVFMNGYRGVCDSNSGDKNQLNDATQTGWTTALGGSVAKIISGPGAQENLNWRRIMATGSASGTVKVADSLAWNVAHTTDSEYVITKSTIWTELTSTGITAPITDVCVANDIAYFAQGDAAPVRMYVCYNNAGTFAETWSSAGPYATFMKTVNDKALGPVIYMARKSAVLNAGFGTVIYKDIAPKGYYSTRGLSSTVLEDCADAWAEQGAITGVTTSYAGSGVVLFTLEASAGTGTVASEAISAMDVRPFNKVDFLVTSSIDLAAGDFAFCMDDTAALASATFTLNFPALIAGDETRVTLDMAPAGVTGASAIISVGVKQLVDKGAMTLKIRGPITLLNEYEAVEIQDQVTGLEAYGDPEVLWVLNEGSLGYIENDQYSQVPIREIQNVASYRNGLAHCVGDVFLYFSLQDGLERYYRQNLDDIGPNLGEGMPSGRKGNISSAVSYPGRIYIAINGGYSGYSSIQCYKGGGWHEVYRTPLASSTVGYGNYMSIRGMHVQTFPDSNIQWLWFCQGNDLLFVQICLNPEQETEFAYAYEGMLTTSWIYAGMKDVKKYWKALKMFVENSASSTNAIVAYYQLDNTTTWTAISGDFDTPPVEENQLSSATPPAVNGRRIRFKFHITQTAVNTCPYVVATVCEGVGFATPKYAYTMNILMGESELNIDLVGDDDTTFANMAAAVAKLDDWAANHTLLTFRSVYGAFDNKTVYIDPISLVPTEFIADNTAGDGREKHMFQITVNEA